MSANALRLGAAQCALWLGASCGSYAPAPNLPSLGLSRTEPFELEQLLNEAFVALGSDTAELDFQALSTDGEPLSFALLEFAWEEGGRTAFQTDEHGRIVLRFVANATPGEATVWLRTVPVGHAFATEPAEAMMDVTRGEVRIGSGGAR